MGSQFDGGFHVSSCVNGCGMGSSLLEVCRCVNCMRYLCIEWWIHSLGWGRCISGYVECLVHG